MTERRHIFFTLLEGSRPCSGMDILINWTRNLHDAGHEMPYFEFPGQTSV